MYIPMSFIITALIFGAVIFFILQCKKWASKMNEYDLPEDDDAWTVYDLRKRLEGLPDDMPVILLDSSTDNVENANYVFTNNDVFIDDFYIFESEEHERGEPSGKALFLSFDNKLNDDPISNYPINLN